MANYIDSGRASASLQEIADFGSFAAPISPFRRWWPVLLLSALYVISLIDRLILAILIQPLKHDLHLSDTQVALLIGSSFAFFYSIVGLPVAWAIDRGNRLWIGIGGVVIWSLSTIASGLAGQFEHLLFLRIGVAIGEAVLTPLGISMIADLFPRHQRGLPMSFFISAGLIGIFSAYSVGGGIVALVGQGAFAQAPVIGDLPVWRAALVITGLPGLVIATLMALTVREPRRIHDADPTAVDRESRFGAFKTKADASRFYLCFILGVGIISMPTYASLAWFPTMLVRAFGVGLAESGYLFSLSMIAAAAALLSIPPLMRYFDRRGMTASLVPIVLAIAPIGALLFGLALVQSNLTLTIPLMIIGYGMLAGGVNAVPTMAVGLTAPAAYRGRLVAIGLASISLLGLGIGPYATAWLAEHVFEGPRAIAHALLALTICTVPIAWTLLYLSWPPFRRALAT